MGAKRRRFTGEEKVAILRRHLVEGQAVSDLCDEHGLSATVFYRWQKELFEHGAAAFERRSNGRERKLEEDNTRLRARLAHKDEVIAEIMESHVELKKSLGER